LYSEDLWWHHQELPWILEPQELVAGPLNKHQRQQ
jgi:hypothetical protein